MLHFGKFNQGRACTVNGRALHSVVEQKELGGTSLSFPESCNTVRQCDECNTACLPSLVRELTIKNCMSCATLQDVGVPTVGVLCCSLVTRLLEGCH